MGERKGMQGSQEKVSPKTIRQWRRSRGWRPSLRVASALHLRIAQTPKDTYKEISSGKKEKTGRLHDETHTLTPDQGE